MIELRTLGRLDLRDSEGREVRSILSPTKRFALLAYLAVAVPRGFHRRDILLALFWPELDQEHARRALRQALYLIRRSMADAVVVSRGDEEIGLDWDAFWCDAAAFEAMLDEGQPEDALEVYRGDLLEGFHLSGCAEFERWLDDEQSRLRKRAAQAAWSLAEREEQAGNAVQAGHWARRGVTLSPGDETALRRLVELLDRLGDRAGAVREYEAFARRLAEEYELEPSAETRELIEAIRSPQEITPSTPQPASSLPAQKAPEDAPSGALADRYAIERELGSGGMAIVYLAEDLKHHRKVAVKVLRPELTAALGAERFLREIEIAARLQHPHILPLHDSGAAQGLLYYVMPYVEGDSLRDRLNRETQLPLEDALQIAREVADALGYAHSHDVIHRDIKPENVLLSGGHAVVADFGIARAISAAGGEQLTQTGLAIGTPAYMSPEQAMGKAQLDARSDIYSLGCLLYEMLAGEPPFNEPSAEAIIARRLTESPPAVSAVRNTVPDPVEQAVTKALARLPADRFTTAAQFAEALVSAGEVSVSVGAVMTPAQLGTAALVRRKRVLATWLAPVLGVVLLVVGAVVAWRTASGSSLDVERVLVDIFQNETGDPSLDPLGRMATDWITQGLTYTGFVDVVSAGTPLLSRLPVGFDTGVRFGPDRLEAAAKAHGTGTVVWGRYYVQGDSLYFQPHVTDARNGEVLATIEPVRAPVDAPLDAMEQLRDRVMTTLATLTDPRLAKWSRYASKPPTFEAYKEFVEGVELHTTQMKFAEAIPHFLRAAALDSSFTMPLLWAMMAGAAKDSIGEALNRRREQLAPLDRHFLDYLLARDKMDALQAIRRVVEIAPGSDYLKNAGSSALNLNRPREALRFLLDADPESGWLRGWFPYWNSLTVAYHVLGDHRKELEAARRSRRQFPNHVSTLGYETRALAALGRTEEVEARVEEGLHLTGRDIPVWFLATEELYAHGQRSAASDILDRVIPWLEGKENQRFYLSLALSRTRRLDESREILEGFDRPSVSVEGFGRSRVPSFVQLGVVAARQGDREEALRIFRLLEERGRAFPTYRSSWEIWHYTYGPAQIAAALGERERAVELLRETIAGSGAFYSMQFHSNRNLESLWDYPPFRELLRPKG